MSFIKFVLFLLFSALFFCCDVSSKLDTDSVYYWKTEADFSQKDVDLWKASGVQKLYLHFFDWDSNSSGSYIRSPLHLVSSVPIKVDCIPVIYITSATLKFWTMNPQFNPMAEAKNMKNLIEMKSRQWKLPPIHEIQMDADWSENTKDCYFAFLKEVKKINVNYLVSVTLRLHQWRDRKTQGIPPVDKVVLLTYGASNAIKMEANSVVDMQMIKAYLKKGDNYPLDCQIALADYGTVRLFNSYNRLVAYKRCAPWVPQDIPKEVQFIGNNAYKVLHAVRWLGILAMPGDTIIVDSVPGNVIHEELKYFHEIGIFEGKVDRKIILYDYDYEEWAGALHKELLSNFHF